MNGLCQTSTGMNIHHLADLFHLKAIAAAKMLVPVVWKALADEEWGPFVVHEEGNRQVVHAWMLVQWRMW